jgi:aerobic-type carbon monoxide dehydrogenase small subunit (CoxS/CutS family)
VGKSLVAEGNPVMNNLVPVSLRVNGTRYDVAIKPWRTLLEVLRETLAMTEIGRAHV